MHELRKKDNKIFTGIFNLRLLLAIDAVIIDAMKLIESVFVKNSAKFERFHFFYVRIDSNGEGYVQLPNVISVIASGRLHGVVKDIKENPLDCSDDLLRLIVKARTLAYESTLNSIVDNAGIYSYSGDDASHFIDETTKWYEPLKIVDNFWLTYPCEAKAEAAKKVGKPFNAFEQAAFAPIWKNYQLAVTGTDKRQKLKTSVGKALNKLEFLADRSELK